MATCRDAYRYVCDNLDQNLDSPRCREIRRHLESCPDCMAYLDSVKKTVSFYHAMPAPKVPRGTHKLLLQALDGVRLRSQKGQKTRSARGRR